MKRKAIDRHLDTAYRLARREVKKRAKQILRTRPELSEFTMAMGTWYFTTARQSGLIYDINNTVDTFHLDRHPRAYRYLKSFAEFMAEYDRTLKLTGEPLWLKWENGKLVEVMKW